jgi:hypothetical protein
VEIRNANDNRSAGNTPHAQNTSQGGLRPNIHLEIPDKEDGQNSQHKITAGSGNTVDIGHVDDDIQIQAVAMDIRGRIELQSNPLPEE